MNRHLFANNLLLHMQQKVVGPVQGFKARNWFRRILTLTLSPSDGEREFGRRSLWQL